MGKNNFEKGEERCEGERKAGRERRERASREVGINWRERGRINWREVRERQERGGRLERGEERERSRAEVDIS